MAEEEKAPDGEIQEEFTVPSLDSGDVAEYDQHAKKIPHYALPNVAAILPDFSNVEQETIMQAFRSGNCTTPQQTNTHIYPTMHTEADLFCLLSVHSMLC
eukprot:SAG11_NODE_851_length_6875_cov_8.193034_3_plen_100_part_00